MTAYIWRCLASTLPPALRTDCDAEGQYDHRAAGESGPAYKHGLATGHPTVAHVAEWAEVAA